MDAFPVGLDDFGQDPGAGLFIETPGTAGDCETRDEPLEVPFERPWQRLVEVVEVEDEGPIG